MARLDEIDIPYATSDTDFVKLVGSPKQVQWAEQVCRAKVLNTVQREHPMLAFALRLIADSTWFIANKDRSFNQIRWPDEWKRAGATGAPAAPVRKTGVSPSVDDMLAKFHGARFHAVPEAVSVIDQLVDELIRLNPADADRYRRMARQKVPV